MNDKPFLPASPNKTAPYLTSVNTHSPYYGMGPGDSHPAFGFTTFRDEPKDAAKSKVWNVLRSHTPLLTHVHFTGVYYRGAWRDPI